MQIAKYRNIIVALLMIAFAGQLVASASISCQSQSLPPQSHEQEADSDMMDHFQHVGLNSSSTDEFAAFDCCPDCDCSLGGCVTAVLPGSQSVFAASLSSLTSYYNGLAENQLAVSLYRPPIAC